MWEPRQDSGQSEKALGECAQFIGLAETLNAAQYLVPRMTAEEIKEAIVQPPRLYGGEVEERLVERIVRDVGANPDDQLPLMQHALLRMWVRSPQRTASPGGDGPVCLALEDYTDPVVVDIYEALSIHGDELLAACDERQRCVVEVMFRRLTDVDDAKREGRRPTSCGTVCKLAGVSLPELQQVLDAFCDENTSFLFASDRKLRACPLTPTG